MITNDPFKTRGKAVKTLLSGVNKICLEHFIMEINDCYDDRLVMEYFESLYKKYPDEFKVNVVSQLGLPDCRCSLYFMNHLVLSMAMHYSTKTVDDFFGQWLNYINIVHPREFKI